MAFLFPGQGSQYPNMLAQVALTFPEVRRVLDRAEATLAGRLERPLGRFLYPGSTFRPEMERANQEAMTRADVAQPAIGAVSLGLSRLLESLGVEPQFLAGHSYGEYVALCAAGAMDEDDLLRLSHRRGAILREKTALMPGGMAALDTDADTAETILADLDGITIANSNAPHQTVIAGREDRLEAALERCQGPGRARAASAGGLRLPLAAGRPGPRAPRAGPGRGSAATATASGLLQRDGGQIHRRPGRHPRDAGRSPDLAGPLPRAGGGDVRGRRRIFVEVGPKGILTGLVGQILRDRPHLAMPSDVPGRARPGPAPAPARPAGHARRRREA